MTQKTQIELTSKSLKKQQLFANLTMLSAFPLAFANFHLGLGIAIVGLIWAVSTSIRIWWNHG